MMKFARATALPRRCAFLQVEQRVVIPGEGRAATMPTVGRRGVVHALASRMVKGGIGFCAGVLLGACVTEPAPQHMDFLALAGADKARILDNDAHGERPEAREVFDPTVVAALYNVVSSRPDGWHRPWAASPRTRWRVIFSRGGRELGSYGVGANFVEYEGYLRNLAGVDLAQVDDLVHNAGRPTR